LKPLPFPPLLPEPLPTRPQLFNTTFLMTCNKPVAADPRVRPSTGADTWFGPYGCFI